MQPILIAAGGGGSSSTVGSRVSPDAQGLINPWDTLSMWQALVTKEDTDAGKSLHNEKRHFASRLRPESAIL